MAKFTFGSRYSGYMLVLDTGAAKYTEKHGYVPKTPFRGVTFNNGIFTTTDESLAEELRKNPSHGVDFWEIKEPSDAERVNIGKKPQVSKSVSSTTTTDGQSVK